jgi:hypothetical protein
MTPVVAVILGLSAVTLVLLLGAFYVTTRQDRESRQPEPPGENPLQPSVDVEQPPQASAGHVGIDYPDPRMIKVGDTIDCQGVRSRVLGATYLSWQGNQWTEYLLDDGTRRYQWLSIETRPGLALGDLPHLEVLLWTSVPTQGMVPAKTTLSVEGVDFFPADRGTAAFRAEGVTSMPERGLLDFADYQAADGRLLSFERLQGQRWSSFYAEPVPPGTIRIVKKKGRSGVSEP